MSGPGPGPWQSDAELAYGRVRLAQVLIDSALLNPDKSLVPEWLREAAHELQLGQQALETAIGAISADPGRASAPV